MLTRTVALLVTLALALTLVLTPGPPAVAGTWADLGVVHGTWSRLQFRGNAMPRPLQAPAAVVTADSAVVLAGDLIDGSLTPGRNRLVELPAGTGEPRILGRRVVGFPMADPSGHRVFWTSLTRHERLRLHGYDTASDTRFRGPTGDLILVAVDGDTVYFAGDRGDGLRSWTPGGGSRPSNLLPPLPEDAFLLDVHGGMRAVLTEAESISVIGADGSVLASGLRGWGTFSPSGSHLTVRRERRTDVWDVAAGRLVELRGLRGRRPFAPRWSPTGELVVTAYLRKADQRRSWDDAHPVTYFRCAMPDSGDAARCAEMRPARRLPEGRVPFMYEPSSLDQLGVMAGS